MTSTQPSLPNVAPVRRSARNLKKSADIIATKKADRKIQHPSLEAHNRRATKLRSHNQQALRHKPSSEVTEYITQDCTFLNLPAEIRTTILIYLVRGKNTDKVANLSSIRWPPLVSTCKQLLAEVPPIFQRINTFRFAVGANYRQLRTPDLPVDQEDKMYAGTLGLLSQQRLLSLTGGSEIRLWDVRFRIYNTDYIPIVRRNIAASRKGKRGRDIIAGSWGSDCTARFSVVGDRLVWHLRHPIMSLQGGLRGSKYCGPQKDEMAAMESAMQKVIDELNGRGGLERGLTLKDVMRLAKTLRVEDPKSQYLED